MGTELPRAKRRKVDFFISRSGADAAWAEWIAWQLEEAGYQVVVQDWDFGAGTNFVLKMQDAIAKAERTIAVMSPDFLKSKFTKSEWSAVFAEDPTGTDQKLIPVRVRLCAPTGLLRTLVRIDLIGLDEGAAAIKLLAELRVGRKKPKSAPPFPGLHRGPKPLFPGAGEVESGRQITTKTPAPRKPAKHLAVSDSLTPREAAERIERQRWGATENQRWGRTSSEAALCVVVVPGNQSEPYLDILKLGDATIQERIRGLALVGGSAVLSTERATQTEEAHDHLSFVQRGDGSSGAAETSLEIHTDGTLVYRSSLSKRAKPPFTGSGFSAGDGYVIDEQAVQSSVAAFLRFANGFYRQRRRDPGTVYLGACLSNIGYRYFGKPPEAALTSFALASHNLEDPLHIPDAPLALTSEQCRAPDAVAKTVVGHFARRFRLENAYCR